MSFIPRASGERSLAHYFPRDLLRKENIWACCSQKQQKSELQYQNFNMVTKCDARNLKNQITLILIG